MSENLIYGANITAYGAVGDGKSDCTEALKAAIAAGESLICFPYGSYKITCDIVLGSNTKLHLHKNAIIILDGAKISAKDCGNVLICGGKIRGEMDFSGVDGVKLQDVSLFERVCFKDCQNIKISHVNLYEKAYFELSSSCQSIVIKGISLNNCECLLKLSGACVKQVKCDRISGTFCDCLINVSLDSRFEDGDFDDISVSHLSKDEGDNKGAYFSFLGSQYGIEIENFKRENDNESTPFIPSLILSPKCDTAIITDGTPLDNVIMARGASKTVEMTTAKLQNPTGKFIYTFECGVAAGDTFTMPFGDFDFASIYEK